MEYEVRASGERFSSSLIFMLWVMIIRSLISLWSVDLGMPKKSNWQLILPTALGSLEEYLSEALMKKVTGIGIRCLKFVRYKVGFEVKLNSSVR